MSSLKSGIELLGGRVESKPCTCGFKHWGPCLDPHVLMERNGEERWVFAENQQHYIDNGWDYVQRGAPLIMAKIQPDGTRETLQIDYERNETVVSFRSGRKLKWSRTIPRRLRKK